MGFKRLIFNRIRKTETKFHELEYLFWECTKRCNLTCLHCGSDCSAESGISDMPADDFLNAVKPLAHKNKILIVISGGEPLVRNDLEACGFKLRQMGFRWGIVTNGMLYNAERHNSLLNAGMGALTISLDGLRENHNWLRNNKLAFEKTKNAIQLAGSSVRLNFDVVTCVNKRNIGELEEIHRFLLENGVKKWRLFTIFPIGRASSNPELILDSLQMKELMDFIASKRKNPVIHVTFSCEAYTGGYEESVRDSYFFCRAGINIGSILADGSISACPNIHKNFVQGNIYTQNLAEVWENKFGVFRDKNWNKNGPCLHCTSYNECLGGGMHNRLNTDGHIFVCHHNLIRDSLPG